MKFMDLAKKSKKSKGAGMTGLSINTPSPSRQLSVDSEMTISRAISGASKDAEASGAVTDQVVDQNPPFVDLEVEGQDITPLNHIVFVPGTSLGNSSALPPPGKKRKFDLAPQFSGKESYDEFVTKFTNVGRQIWDSFQLGVPPAAELEKEVRSLRLSEQKAVADLSLLRGSYDSANATVLSLKDEKAVLESELEKLRKQVSDLKVDVSKKDLEMEKHMQSCAAETKRLQDLLSDVSRTESEAVLAYKRSDLCSRQVAAISQPMLWQGYWAGVEDSTAAGGVRENLANKDWLVPDAESIASTRYSEFAAGLDVSSYLEEIGGEEEGQTPPIS